MKNNYDLFFEWESKLYDVVFKAPWENKFEDYKEYLIESFCKRNNIQEDLFYETFESLPEEVAAFITQLVLEFFLEQTFMPDNINVIDSYLRRFKYRISRDTIEYFQEVRSKAYSIYKITDIKPGKYIIVQDLLLDIDNISIVDDGSSENLEIGDLLLAKIILYKNENYFGTMHMIFKENVSPIKRQIDKLLKNEAISDKKQDICVELLRSQYENLWCSALLPLYKETQGLQEDFNIQPQKMIFKIKNVEKLIETLDNLKHKEIIRGLKKQLLWYFVENLEDLINGDGKKSKIMSEIKIQDNKLICESIFEGVLQKLCELIREDIKECVGFPVIEKVDFDDDDNQELTREDELRIIRAFYDKHLMETLNVKVPVLNNKKPKESLNTEPDIFYSWLDSFVENIEKQTENTYDYEWFLDELCADKSRYLK